MIVLIFIVIVWKGTCDYWYNHGMWYINLVCFFSAKTMGIIKIYFGHCVGKYSRLILLCGIGPLQLGVVLLLIFILYSCNFQHKVPLIIFAIDITFYFIMAVCLSPGNSYTISCCISCFIFSLLMLFFVTHISGISLRPGFKKKKFNSLITYRRLLNIMLREISLRQEWM